MERSSGGRTTPPPLTRLARWRGLLVAVLAALATAGLLATSAPRALAQPVQVAQPARPAAPVTIPVGVQDGWINGCDSASAPDYTPKKSVPAVDSPYWAALGMNTVRFSPVWDIASYHPATADGKALAVEQACFNYWLKALGAKGATPEIAFKPDYNYTSGNRIMIPDLNTYAAAIQALVSTYSCPTAPAGALCPDGLARVSIIAPWGEPESKARARSGRPSSHSTSSCGTAAGSTPPTARPTPATSTAARRGPRRCGSWSITAARPAPTSPGTSAVTGPRISLTCPLTTSTCATCTAARPSTGRACGPAPATRSPSSSSAAADLRAGPSSAVPPPPPGFRGGPSRSLSPPDTAKVSALIPYRSTS
jgi:hypothetical protein